MEETDVAIIGAGPAGMSAALAAVEAGARVTLIDEYAKPGGQFFKRAGEAFALSGAQFSREYEAGEALRRALAATPVSVLTGTLVWGAAGRTLMLYREGRSEALSAKAIVLATGAYDRPVAFPGWTLPGVMSAGGAQSLARTQWVRPGRRMLLAGAGPFLLPVAHQLLRAGVEIEAILEATQPRQWLRHLPALWGQWPRFAEAWDYRRALRRAKVPTLYRQKPVRALGTDRLRAVVVAEVDASWRALPGTEREIAVDALAIGYGFLPNVELAEMLGCEMRWDGHGQAWFVACGADLATSVEGVFAAGEITGIGGSALALAEGRIAGIGAAERAGLLTPGKAAALRRAPERRRARLAVFAAALNTLFRPRPGLWEGIGGETILCRCEEVAAATIGATIDGGCTTLKGIKDWTRAGMGLCQGRMCRGLVTQMIAAATGVDAGRIPRPRVRPPIKPIPMAAAAEAEMAEGEMLVR